MVEHSLQSSQDVEFTQDKLRGMLQYVKQLFKKRSVVYICFFQPGELDREVGPHMRMVERWLDGRDNIPAAFVSRICTAYQLATVLNENGIDTQSAIKWLCCENPHLRGSTPLGAAITDPTEALRAEDLFIKNGFEVYKDQYEES